MNVGNYYVMAQMGKTALAEGDYPHAEAIFTEVLALIRQFDSPFLLAEFIKCLARAAFEQGKYANASQYYDEASQIGREIRDFSLVAHSLRGLAEISRINGDIDSAMHLYRQILLPEEERLVRRDIFLSLEGLARLLIELGQPQQAVPLLSATQDLYDANHFSFWPLERSDRPEMLSRLKSQLDEAVFNEAWGQGKGWPGTGD